MIRRRKKVRKMRGSRVHGYGRISGGHRKSGQRGGKGGAGMRGQHWILTIKQGRIRQRGFKRNANPIKLRPIRAINLEYINSHLEAWKQQGIIDSEEKLDLVAMGYDKVLGTGALSEPLTIIAPSFSEKARERIESIGGAVVVPKDEE